VIGTVPTHQQAGPADGVDQFDADGGMILIPTLILTLVLSIVVVAVLGYVTAGLMTSKVTTERTESATDAAAAIYWTIESIATGPGVCPAVVPVPAAAMPRRTPAEVTCAQLVAEDAATGTAAQALLAVASTGAPSGRITAIVEYGPSAAAPRAVRIVDWDTGTGTTG
jgi:hypothetical protein